MKLFVLYGQRICRYPDEYGLEALECMDEYGYSDNPEYLEGKRKEHEESQDFESLAIVELDVNEQAVRSILFPKHNPIQAAVVENQNG